MTLFNCKPLCKAKTSSVIDFSLSYDTYDTMTLLAKPASELVKQCHKWVMTLYFGKWIVVS
jgi:hypothetical protein